MNTAPQIATAHVARNVLQLLEQNGAIDIVADGGPLEQNAMTPAEIASGLGWHLNAIDAALEQLRADGLARELVMHPGAAAVRRWSAISHAAQVEIARERLAGAEQTVRDAFDNELLDAYAGAEPITLTRREAALRAMLQELGDEEVLPGPERASLIRALERLGRMRRIAVELAAAE